MVRINGTANDGSSHTGVGAGNGNGNGNNGFRCGGRRWKMSPYFFIIVMVIQFEFAYYVYLGGVLRNNNNDNDGIIAGTSSDNNNGMTTSSAAFLASSTSSRKLDNEDRISNLEQKLEQVTKLLESHDKTLQDVVLNKYDSSLSSTSSSSSSLITTTATDNNQMQPLSPLLQHHHQQQFLSNDQLQERMILVNDKDGTQYVNPLYRFDESVSPLCFPWTINSDVWWTHNPEWTVKLENDTSYCFSPMAVNSLQRDAYTDLYKVQYHGDCKQVLSKRMWSSGWGADFANVVDGLIKAVETQQPFQVTDNTWHYAAKKDGSAPVCPLKTMECYFLPLSKCKARKRHTFEEEPFFGHNHPHFDKIPDRYYLKYATRPKVWFRHAIYNFTKTITLTAPCTVMHVRRGDVVLHGKYARRYFAIEEYVNAIQSATNKNITETVFLITDDANAVTEARAKFPHLNWVVIDRPRFKGKEGGWENHIPSNNPLLETLVLMSIFRLSETCNSLVHSQSNLSNYIAGIMKSIHRKSFVRVNLDQSDLQRAYNSSHQDTFNISKSDWSDLSQKRRG